MHIVSPTLKLQIFSYKCTHQISHFPNRCLSPQLKEYMKSKQRTRKYILSIPTLILMVERTLGYHHQEWYSHIDCQYEFHQVATPLFLPLPSSLAAEQKESHSIHAYFVFKKLLKDASC